MDIESVLRQVGTPEAPVRAEPKKMRRVPGVKARDWTLPGFGPLTRITTSFGDVPAQALREGDTIRTKSGQFKKIAWIDRIGLDEEFLSLHPDALPVHVHANALGRGVPSHDLFLSPSQPLDGKANRLSDRYHTARDLIGRPGVLRRAEAMYTYTLFHVGEPAVVQASKVFLSVEP